MTDMPDVIYISDKLTDRRFEVEQFVTKTWEGSPHNVKYIRADLAQQTALTDEKKFLAEGIAKIVLRIIDTGDTDYLVVRRRISELSGLPMMAATFDEHINKIRSLLQSGPAVKEGYGKANAPARHIYQPDIKYPWYCSECGYAEHERLKHPPAATKVE